MQEGGQNVSSTQLLRSIAEQLKLPLTVLARHAELGRSMPLTLQDLEGMQTHASAALTLVDSYLLGLELQEEQTRLALEPVSISSLLVEIMHELQPLARRYGVVLRLDIAGRYEPVMAHKRGLKAALLSMGHVFITGESARQKRAVTMAVHRTGHGITTGMYGAADELRTADWHTALALCGKARQPLAELTTGAGAGVFVAEAIMQAMESEVQVTKHARQWGLAMTLQPSQQLCFV